jgi:L-lactate utilization protein LutB
MSNWKNIPNNEIINSTVQEMLERGFNPELVETREEALALIKTLIPANSEVMTGSSTTLSEIGLSDYLEGDAHPWNNLKKSVMAESDEQKRGKLRRLSASSDYFLASANAIAQTGELIFVDATGSRVTALPYSAGKVILVVGAQKIVPSIDEGMKRIREFVFPLEDARAQAAYGMGSGFGKWLIIENEFAADRIKVILVKEALGF